MNGMVDFLKSFSFAPRFGKTVSTTEVVVYGSLFWKKVDDAFPS